MGWHWLTASGPAGHRRIDDPDDWIRRELSVAFEAGVRVIPILTEQTAIPAEADRPADIARLSRCQFRRLRQRDATGDLARIVADLKRTGTGAEPAVVDVECPYPGLAAFGPEQAQWFFGRDRLVAQIVEQAGETLRTGRPLMVVAPSGAGKSSLLRAGVLPRIGSGALPATGSMRWPQLWLTTAGEEEATPVALVLCGLRSDFYTPCAAFPVLRDALQHNQVFVGSMSREELGDAIRLPADTVGLRFESGLVDLLLEDLAPG